MQMPTRKENTVTTPFTERKSIAMNIVYAISFFALCWYSSRGQLELTEYMASEYGYSLSMIPTNFAGYIMTLIISGLMSCLVAEVMMKLYYFFAYRYMRGLMPFSVNEFKTNFRPFLIIRNLIVGLLSLLCLTENGYFIIFGLNLFEMLATMIVIFPFYFFMKKYYIKDGYGGRVLVSFAIPFVLFNSITYISLLV